MLYYNTSGKFAWLVEKKEAITSSRLSKGSFLPKAACMHTATVLAAS